jgi:hypothetical protein
MKETLWKNNLNFVKDVTPMFLNVITIVIVVSELFYVFLCFFMLFSPFIVTVVLCIFIFVY